MLYLRLPKHSARRSLERCGIPAQVACDVDGVSRQPRGHNAGVTAGAAVCPRDRARSRVHAMQCQIRYDQRVPHAQEPLAPELDRELCLQDDATVAPVKGHETPVNQPAYQ